MNKEITSIPIGRMSVGEVGLPVKHPASTVEVPAFYRGKSAYQSYVETTDDNPVLSEKAWSALQTRINIVDELPETGNPNEFYAIFE